MAGNKGKTAVWVILGLAVLGFGGFGVTNFSGGASKLGTVGTKTLTALDYQRDLSQQMRALQAQTGQPVSFPLAQSIGLDQQVLNALVTNRTLDNETGRLGLSVGDARVLDQIQGIQAFAGLDGNFDRTTYNAAIKQLGYGTVAAFETSIREETARNVLQTAVVNGVKGSQTYTDTLVTYLSERRDVSWAAVTASNLATPVAAPSDTDIAAYYAAHPEDFTTPETREITYAWVTPEMLKDGVEIDDAAIRELYDQRIADFVQPERRLVERLAFVDAAAAETALAAITAGTATFDGLVTDRGLELADVDLGDVSLADLGAAGDAVFAAETGAVVGPFDSPIGPALFRMNAVLAAEETTFDEAKPDLRDELATTRARRLISDMSSEINDLMAGGATLEDLADRTELTLGTIEWTDTTTDGIAAYDGFRTAAAAAKVGDFPTLVDLDDGGVFALRIDAIREPALQDLDEVKPEVIAKATASATLDAIRAEADRLAALVDPANGWTPSGLTPMVEAAITRRNFIPGTTAEFLTTVFGMAEGEVKVLPADEGAIVVQVTKILPPDPADPDTAAQRQSIDEQVRQGIARDIFTVYSTVLRSQTAVSIDQSAVNAVHASFQ